MIVGDSEADACGYETNGPSGAEGEAREKGFTPASFEPGDRDR